MKPFDFRAAKRGDPIVRHFPLSEETHDVSFVGVRKNGDIVVELDSGALMSYPSTQLRMRPVKRTVYVRVFLCGNKIHSAKASFTPHDKCSASGGWTAHDKTMEIEV